MIGGGRGVLMKKGPLDRGGLARSSEFGLLYECLRPFTI